MTPHPPDLTSDRILDYIDQHFAEAISPCHVAGALHYSLCHLTHVARRMLGASISELILERRIAAAQDLLAESALPVSAIARQVGFADGAYFSRRFARATGASPTTWRNVHRTPRQRARCHACGRILSHSRQQSAS